MINNYIMNPLFIVLLLLMYITEVVTIFGGVKGCQDNCEKFDRLTGPTKMKFTRPHPWFVTSFPIKNNGFCKLGCQYFFAGSPEITQCKAKCLGSYRYKVSAQYADVAEESILNCQDGCDIAVQVCQEGFFCKNGDSSDITVTTLDFERVLMCYRDTGNVGSATCIVVSPTDGAVDSAGNVRGIQKGVPLVVSSLNPSSVGSIATYYNQVKKKPVICFRDDIAGATSDGKFGRCVEIYEGTMGASYEGSMVTSQVFLPDTIYRGTGDDLKQIFFNTRHTEFISVTGIGSDTLVCFQDTGGNGGAVCRTIVPDDVRQKIGASVTASWATSESVTVTSYSADRAVLCYQIIGNSTVTSGLGCNFLDIQDSSTSLTISSRNIKQSGMNDNIVMAKVKSDLILTCYREMPSMRPKCFTITDTESGSGFGSDTVVTTIPSSHLAVAALSDTSGVICMQDVLGHTGICHSIDISNPASLTYGPALNVSTYDTEYIGVAKVTSTDAMVCYRNSGREGAGTCSQVRFDQPPPHSQYDLLKTLVINDYMMLPCPPGRFREPTQGAANVSQCTNCPAGRYRSQAKGKAPDACSPCPKGKYAAVTGSVRVADCLRCPAGKTAEYEGMGACSCITAYSCGMFVEENGKIEEYYVEPLVVDYYRESIPYIGRS